uniref:Immunoglobulin V-set domain-containing protein n=1 Tax=Oreochromis aureus TaxID=47969 RepID=A0AAZ1XQX1_OREAU
KNQKCSHNFIIFLSTKVTQPYRVVSTNGVAQIQCVIHPQSLKYPYPEEARVSVLKGLHGHQELCFSILNFTDQRETQNSARGNEASYVTLSGLNVTDTDMYRCEIWIFYPPLYLELIGNGTLIHVLGEATALACLSTELKFLVHIFFSVLRFLFSVHRQLQLPLWHAASSMCRPSSAAC